MRSLRSRRKASAASRREPRGRPLKGWVRTIHDTDARVSQLAYELLQVFHDQEQVIGVRWAGVEVEMFMERPGFVILGCNKECTNTGNIRGLGCASKGVFQQGLTDAPAMLSPINGESG